MTEAERDVTKNVSLPEPCQVPTPSIQQSGDDLPEGRVSHVTPHNPAREMTSDYLHQQHKYFFSQSHLILSTVASRVVYTEPGQ